MMTSAGVEGTAGSYYLGARLTPAARPSMFIKHDDEWLGQRYIEPNTPGLLPEPPPNASGASGEWPLPCVDTSISCLRAGSAVPPAPPGDAIARCRAPF